jgi:unsaturated chondroitin disaccharide hydrolase
MRVDPKIRVADLAGALTEFWQLSGSKIRSLEETYDFDSGAPVYTVAGRYTARGWTEWTLGFHYGSAVLQYEVSREEEFLRVGREGAVRRMVCHLTHMGVHDHGFNIVSTFGNLRRLAAEGILQAQPWEMICYELALRVSAAVQARRWMPLPDGGYIYSFNGPHSLFADTMRSLRSLALGHLLGHSLLEEGDREVSLLERLIQHAQATARYNVYFGRGRDLYDVRGRVAHESIFNTVDGSYRCPNSQQGYSPRSTWTRGLAWVMLGFAEQLEFLGSLQGWDVDGLSREDVLALMLETCRATCDFYVEQTPANGIPYWDTAAPGLSRLAHWKDQPADPFNDEEPVDSSAAAIAAQALLRLGRYLTQLGEMEAGSRYHQAGLTVSAALLAAPYLSRDPGHQGLILHSVYHRPNGWDHVPAGRSVPCGESSMWGDYHARELALLLWREIQGRPWLTFWTGGQAA